LHRFKLIGRKQAGEWIVETSQHFLNRPVGVFSAVEPTIRIFLADAIPVLMIEVAINVGAIYDLPNVIKKLLFLRPVYDGSRSATYAEELDRK
jgi:hypothetical protein